VGQKSAAELKQRIEQLSEVYTLPSVLLEILAICNDPGTSPRDISQCVEHDQAIAMKVLSVANSAYTGLRQRVSSIPLAVHLLGPREVVQIATAVGVFQFASGTYRDPRLSLSSLWRHVMQTAAVAGLLGDRLGRPSTGSEFTAGLLHDIGKVVMAQEMPEEITRSLDLAGAEGISATDAETRLFGTTHADVGGWLAESWGLPQRLVEAITYHHRPMSALMATPASRDPALSAIVYLANVVAQPVDAGRICNIPVDPKTLDTTQKLVELEYPGVNADRLADMLDGISASLDRAELFRAGVETTEPGGDQQ